MTREQWDDEWNKQVDELAKSVDDFSNALREHKTRNNPDCRLHALRICTALTELITLSEIEVDDG